MMRPAIFRENLFDNFFDDFFLSMEYNTLIKPKYGRDAL